MAKYAKQLEQVLDLMLKADARKVQIKESKMSVDLKDDKQFRSYQAEAREIARNVLVSMSRDILSEQDLADLNDASSELEGDVTADTADASSDRIEDEERGFTDDGSEVDDVTGSDEFSAGGAEGGDDVSALVDDLLDLVGPDEAKNLIDDKGAEGGNADELDEFANVDDTAIEDGEGEDLDLDSILKGLGDEGTEEGGEGDDIEDFGGDDEASEEGGDDEAADDGEEAGDDFGGDTEEEGGEAEEEEEAEPVSESLRARTRVNRRGK